MTENSGFTLIELILVTVIIGILAGMVALNFGGRAEEARTEAARGDIAMLSTAIDLYALDNNDQYPETLAELLNPKSGRKYVREYNGDPWKRDYVYKRLKEGGYEIFSRGADGEEGTEDDIRPGGTELVGE
jgi:general secretion pathway protein G